MMSLQKKIIYFILLGILTVVVLSGIRNDKQYTIKSERFETAEDGSLCIPYLSLWNGNYTFQFDYQSSTDVPVKLYVDKKECAQFILQSDQKQLNQSYMLGINTDLFQFSIPLEYTDQVQVEQIIITSEKLLYSDTIFLALFVLLTGIVCFLIITSKWWNKQTRNERVGKILIVIAVIAVSLPFKTEGVIDGWDTWGHLLRIESVKDAFYLGQFPVMIFPKNCNGYGQLGAMYPLTPLYLIGIFRCFHMSIATCYKMVFVFANIATAIVTYLAVKSIAKSDYAAVLATILYCLAPYRIMNLFCRQAMGEIIAMIFVPLVVVGLYHIFYGEDKRYWFLLTIGYCGIIQAHIVSVLLIIVFSLLVGIICVCKLAHESRWKNLIKALVFTLLLNVWYLIPFFTFMSQGTNNSIIFGGFLQKGTTLIELLSDARWAYDGGLGVIGLVGATCCICSMICLAWLVYKKKTTDQDRFMGVILACAVLFIWMETAYFPWGILSKITWVHDLTNMMQFPFRFLIVGTPLLIISTGYFISRIVNRKAMYFVTGCIMILNLTGTVGYMFDFAQGEGSYDRLYGGVTEIAIPENYPMGADSASCKNDIIYPYSYEMNAQQTEKQGNDVRIVYSTTKENDYIDIPLYYFAGYSAEVTAGELPVGMQLRVEQGAEYRVRVHLPKSECGTEVRIHYTGMKIFYIGYAISLISMIAFILFIRPRKSMD